MGSSPTIVLTDEGEESNSGASLSIIGIDFGLEKFDPQVRVVIGGSAVATYRVGDDGVPHVIFEEDRNA